MKFNTLQTYRMPYIYLFVYPFDMFWFYTFDGCCTEFGCRIYANTTDIDCVVSKVKWRSVDDSARRIDYLYERRCRFMCEIFSRYRIQNHNIHSQETAIGLKQNYSQPFKSVCSLAIHFGHGSLEQHVSICFSLFFTIFKSGKRNQIFNKILLFFTEYKQLKLVFTNFFFESIELFSLGKICFT